MNEYERVIGVVLMAAVGAVLVTMVIAGLIMAGISLYDVWKGRKGKE